MSLSRGALAAGAAVTAAAAVTLTVVLWPDSSDPARRSDSRTSPGATSAAPSPTRSYPLSKTPRTIPAVREHTPAHGPGWRPGKGSSVVIADGSKGLADEGRLLAGELKIGYRGAAAARAGDVELALTPTAEGGPESYTLKTHDGRVTISGPGQAGVFYGTRTLKQSVRADGSMPEGEVRDRPDRPQRGLNLDIARKFYSVGWIEDRLRDMADLKLNQLGLHFSDDQAFRVESDTHPEIVSPEHLTKAQVRQIVALVEAGCTSRWCRRSTPRATSARSCAPTPTSSCAMCRAWPRRDRSTSPSRARRSSSTSSSVSTRNSSPALTGIWAPTSTSR